MTEYLADTLYGMMKNLAMVNQMLWEESGIVLSLASGNNSPLLQIEIG
ncbi:MAG: hypothetical protein LBG96_09170 [Tannerella sp.]|jgi:hypothetical protein|nr:hypothetical protein [Tannerella sp.]